VTLSGLQATAYADVRLLQSSRQSRHHRSLLVVPAANGLPGRRSSEPAGTSDQGRGATWHRRNTPFPYLVIVVFQSASVRSLADEYRTGSTAAARYRRPMTCSIHVALSVSRPTVCPVLFVPVRLLARCACSFCSRVEYIQLYKNIYRFAVFFILVTNHDQQQIELSSFAASLTAISFRLFWPLSIYRPIKVNFNAFSLIQNTS
jgi:hypothetical protein